MQNNLPENVFPITPPPALVHQWAYTLSSRSDQAVFTEVAQWGADQEREAMLAELKALHLPDGYAAKLRAARRPKPPSLKEQALEQLRRVNAVLQFQATGGETSVIRLALESLID